MRKIGVLYGMENTFPPALVERINEKRISGVSAESIRIGCTQIGEPSGYAVLIDRISHDVEFYRAYLKNAVVTGTCVLNDPFRAGMHDRFYGYAEAAKLGIAVPRAAIFPQKEHPTGTTVQSMRNLTFPLDWNRLFGHVGFPAQIRAVKGGRWKGKQTVHSPEEFFAAYDNSGSTAMFLQQVISAHEQFRCYLAGDQVRVIPYDPSAPNGQRYGKPATEGSLHSKLARDTRALGRGLGLEIATIDFAVQEGVPYALEVAHAAPEADVHSLGEEHFEWLLEAVAQLAIERAATEVRAFVAGA